MAVQDLFWIAQRKNRKTGELGNFSTKEAFIAMVDNLHASVYIEPTDKVRGYAGSLLDAPDGSYDIRGPGFKRYSWDAVLTVNRRTVPPYGVV